LSIFNGIKITAFGYSVEGSSMWNAVIDGYFETVKYNLTDEGGILHQAYRKSIPPIILKHVQDRFWTETTPEGESWKPLAQFTVESKTRMGYQYIQNPGILQATRNMYNSIDAIPIEGWGISFGSDDPLAKKHQYGDIKLPARPFLGWNNQMEIDVQSKMQSLVNEISSTL